MLRDPSLLVLVIGVAMAAAQMFPSLSFNTNDSYWHYTNNLYQDAYLKVPNLIAKYHYPIELHTVTTSDGYILELHRMPHGRNKNNVLDGKKPVVFLMHGLFCSSSVWVIMGPVSGLAYILAEEGYDVWMGNARGNIYSRNHISLNAEDSEYWRFSWDEIGNIDLPAMVDYVLQYTRKRKLHYIGHSQGTTTFFVLVSLRPEYNEKFISMHALAPVVYMANNRNILLNLIAPFSTSIETIDSLMGIREFAPNNALLARIGQAFCKKEVIMPQICDNIVFLIGGWNEEQLNTTMLPIVFGHLPAGASVRQLLHYAQGIRSKQFRRFDYGSRKANIEMYKSFSPPKYDLGKVTTPVILYYADNDPLSSVTDVDNLYGDLDNPMGKYKVPLDSFTHVDFIFAVNVKDLVYNSLLDLLDHMDLIGSYRYNDWNANTRQ